MYIAYCRKSRLQDPEELLRQEQLIHDYCNNKGYKLEKLYSEVGSSVDPDRPQYKLMLQYLTEHVGVTIVVTDYDRIGRDTLLLSLFKQLCKEHKHLVELINGIVYSYDNYTDIFTQEILSSVSAYIYQQTKAKMQRGLKQFMECGGKIGNTPIGYIKKDKYTYVLDLEKCDIIRQIFTDIADGMPTKEVVDKLESIGFRSNNGKRIGTREVRNIIKNERYYSNNPQIVSKELWLKANSQLRSLVNSGKRSYPLSNKIICSHCNTSLIIGFRADRGLPVVNSCNSSNSVRHNNHPSCTCQGVRYDVLENLVKSDCKAYIENRLAELYQKLTEDKELLSAHNAELKATQAEIVANKEKLSKLNTLFIMDNISQEELKEKSEVIKDRINLLELKLQRLEGYSLFKIAEELQYKIIKLEELQSISDIKELAQLVDYVSYYKDAGGIQVNTKFKEGI